MIHCERLSTGAVSRKTFQLPPISQIDGVIELTFVEDIPMNVAHPVKIKAQVYAKMNITDVVVMSFVFSS
jgi:hypothetical protein